MRILYDIVIFIYNVFIHLAAFTGNEKAGLWCRGRDDWEKKIKNALEKSGKKRVWIHCASLGEFEQGRTVIERLKLDDPSLVIILSFFSPSGYEIRKNYPYADLVCYLPIDTKKNAEKFIESIAPSFVIFIKYEFWPHYFEEIRKKQIPLYLVSVIFRPSQVFFKWYGSFYRNVLRNVSFFFVQDQRSASLLSENGFNNFSVTGDTRFDRVRAVTIEKKKFQIIDEFKKNNSLLVAGSTWPEDEEILLSVLGEMKKEGLKIVIAPHEVNEKRIEEIVKKANEFFNLSEIARYTAGNGHQDAKVLIIDTIGILSSVYGYGNIAWIGGGFGKGIHNILEAASYGIPVIFGPNYKKFREAVELSGLKGAFSVNDKKEAKGILTMLINDDNKLTESGKIALKYVDSNTGATERILSLIK